MNKPAAFIDRDGTLVEEVNFLSRIEDLRVFPFAAEALRLLSDAGFYIVVVTNQSGIGRGLYTEADMHAIHLEMQRQLGGLIDAFYFCPHLPNAGCRCRKPNLGMIETAAKDLSIDLANSVMIGDKALDVETGFNGGFLTAMVRTGYGVKDAGKLNARPDVIADDLLEAVRRLLDGGPLINSTIA